jgi:hypothetical protein
MDSSVALLFLFGYTFLAAMCVALCIRHDNQRNQYGNRGPIGPRINSLRRSDDGYRWANAAHSGHSAERPLPNLLQ